MDKNDVLVVDESSKYQLRCGGGKFITIISEEGLIRPCSYLPANIFNTDTVDGYIESIINNSIYSYEKQMKNYEKYSTINGRTMDHLNCAGFCG